MKRNKRVVAVLLAFAMVFSLIPGNAVLTVQAAGDDESVAEEVVIESVYSDALFKDAEGSQYYLKYLDHWYKGEPIKLSFVKLESDKIPEPQGEEEIDEAYKARVKKALDGATLLTKADLSNLVDDVADGDDEEVPTAPVVSIAPYSIWSYISVDLTPDNDSYVTTYKDYYEAGLVNNNNNYVSVSRLKGVYALDTDLNGDDKEELKETKKVGIAVEWLDPIKFIEPKDTTYDLTEHYADELEEPTYEAASDEINLDNYEVRFSYSYGVDLNSDHPKVYRDGQHDVLCTPKVYRLDEPDEDGERYMIGDGYRSLYSGKGISYTDETKYEYVKIADGEDITEGEVTSKTAYYLEYNPNIFNGDKFYHSYVRIKGDDKGVTPSADNVLGRFRPSDDYTLTQKDSKADVVLKENGEYDFYTKDYVQINYENFVQKDAKGNKIYPDGTITYTLTYPEDTTIGYDDSLIAGPIEFKLNWKLPGEFDATEDTKEVVFNEGDNLFLPGFTPDEERNGLSYYYSAYDWYYTDEENGRWEDASDHGIFNSYGDAEPEDNGYYRCVLTVKSYVYSGPDGGVYQVEQLYHASKVNVKPVGFIDKQDGSVSQNYKAGTIRTSVGQNVKIDPDVQTSSGYDVTYQWYKDDEALADKTDSVLSINSITEGQMGNYKLVASAKLSGQKEVCYKATYSVTVANDPYTYDQSADSAWRNDDSHAYAYYSVGEVIEKEIPLVLDNGYSASYQWYKRDYVAVPEDTPYTDKKNEYYGWENVGLKSETDDNGKAIEGKQFRILSKYKPIEGQTSSGLKDYKVSESDFVINLKYNNKDYTYLRSGLDYNSYFYCDVTVKQDKVADGETAYEHQFWEYLDINETYSVALLYTPDADKNIIEASNGEDVTLTAPAYEITDNYAVQYKWEKGEPDKDDPEDIKWKEIEVKKKDNILKVAAVDETKAGLYRVSLSVVRAESNALVKDRYFGYNSEYYYNISLNEKEEVSYDVRNSITVYRKTPAVNETKLGDTVTLEVEAETAKQAGKCTYTYQWYLNNEKIKGADKPTYTIESVNVLQFGEYRCKVTATNPDAIHIPVYELEYEKDDEGQYKLDEYGQKIPVYETDEDGQPIYDDDGEPIKVYAKDKDGNKIIAKDEDGNEIYRPDGRTDSVFSAEFVVREDAGITVTTPVAQTSYISDKTVGDKVTLSVAAKADDDGKLTYTWYRRDIDTTSKTYDSLVKIEGADKPSLEITLSENDFTTYTVRISNSRGEKTRDFVISDSKLSSLIQAKDGVTRFDKKLGESVDLTVTAVAEAEGTTFEYVWYKVDDVDAKIAGADKSTYSIKELTEEALGTYECDVYSVKDNNRSYQKTITFVVDVIPEEESTSDAFSRVDEYGDGTIAIEATNRIGDKIKFGVEPVEGNNGKYTYKWVFVDEETYRESGTSRGTELLKQTTGVLTFNGITEDQFGYYKLTVYDEDGDPVTVYDEDGESINTTFLVYKNTNDGELTVDVEADEDDTTPLPNRYIVKAKQGDNVELKVNAQSTNGDVTYQWYKGGTAIYEETSATLELKDLKTADFARYTCAITDGVNKENVVIRVSRTANLKIQSDLIPVTDGNKYEYNVIRGIGQNAKLDVNATADEGFTITYQWYKAAELLKGETSNSLNVENIAGSDYDQYRCEVTVALGDGTKEIENVFFNLIKDDAFLNIMSIDEDGEEVNETPAGYYTYNVYTGLYERVDGTDAYKEAVYGDAETQVTLKPIVRVSKGYDVSYQWYHWDKVQKRYVKLEDATGDSYQVDVTEDELYDAKGKVNEHESYKCEISTSFRTVTYYATLQPLSEAATNTLTIDVDKEYIYEGNDVIFTTSFDGNTEGLTYQWYTEDEEGNIREIPNATKDTYTAKAPIVTREETGSNVEQKDMQYVQYTCIVSRDGKIVDRESSGFNSVMVPAETDKVPEITLAKIKSSYDIRGYKVDGASSITLQFSSDFRLGNSDADLDTKLYILEQNGNVTIYDTSEGQEIAGKEIVVSGDTVLLFYVCPALDKNATVKQATALVNADNYGYKITMAKDTAVIQQEIADAAEKAAAEKAAAEAAANQAAAEAAAKEAAEKAAAEKAAADQAAVDNVKKAIEAIGTVTADDASKARIDAARAAYNNLTEEQKKSVDASLLNILTTAESTYAAAKAEADKALDAAKKVGATKISSAKNSKSKKIVVKLKKVTGATGYQVKYSTKKNMKSSKTKNLTGTSVTLSKLKKGKTYYIQARSYATYNGTKYYSKWTAKKKVKVNK